MKGQLVVERGRSIPLRADFKRLDLFRMSIRNNHIRGDNV